MTAIIIFCFALILLYLLFRYQKSNKGAPLPLPEKCKQILREKVSFYNALSLEEKERFEEEIMSFLAEVKVTGVDTSVSTTDRMLLAASAIIPVFAFPEWEYPNLKEVILYPKSFNLDFETEGNHATILGVVGNRHLQDTMILSKKALHHGFANSSDKQNTAIHEFVHLIDKMDGQIDGVPEVLLERPFVIPWINLMQEKIVEINKSTSDINPYGGTNKAEFYAVIGEYFFERPKLLKHKHPELYQQLTQIFKQKMANRDLTKKLKPIGRNQLCACGSKKKYKHCCGFAS